MMKKICLLLCALLVAGALMACGGAHTHTFDTVWDKDATGHWHNATCDHADQVSDRGDHVDTDKDNICDVCGYIDTHVHTFEETWTVTTDNHYHKATCQHTDVIKDEGKHADADKDGLCDVCAYDYGHTHTYATEWSADESNHWYAVTCDHEVDVKDKAAHADADQNGACDTCAYVMCTHTFATEWSTDENNHWYDNTCEKGCDVTKDMGAHGDENKDGKCDVCAYVLCAHTFAEAWSSDEVDHWHAAACALGCEVTADRGIHADENGDGACDVCAYTANHFHTYGDEPAFDAVNHWYAPTCEHTDVKGAVAPHADADGDGACDGCPFTTRHTVTLTYPAYIKVTDANNNPLTGSFVLNNGEMKTLLITVPDTAVLAMVTGAAQVGDAQIVDGGKLYTFEVRDLLEDVTVKVSANKLVGAEEVEEKEATLELDKNANYKTITFNAPAAGKYFIYDPKESGVMFGPAGSTTMSEYKNVYYFEVSASGEASVGVLYFNMQSLTELDYSYLICQYEDEFILSEFSGEGYHLPNNVVVKLTFIAPEPGLYMISSSASNLVWNVDIDAALGSSTTVEATEAGQVITVAIRREAVDEVTFGFDWNVVNLNGTGDEIAVGENSMTVPNGYSVPVTFTAPADGSYSFAFTNIYCRMYLWLEEYKTMYEMGGFYTMMDAKAGDKITLYVMAIDDNYDGDDVAMTDDVEAVLTVIDMGTVMGEDGEAVANADGAENQYLADWDGGDYIFTAPDGVTMSFDGGETWVSEATIALEANQLLSFLVKTADGAETAILSIVEISYMLDVEVQDNAATYTFTMHPGKDYLLSIYGWSITVPNVTVTWGGADITATFDGRPMAEGDVLEGYSPWSNMISLVLSGDEPVEITITVQGTAGE